MTGIKQYHRPETLEEALSLLQRDGVSSAVIGGGTSLVANQEGIEEIIDLQGLGLVGLRRQEDWIYAGATTRLQDLADFDGIPSLVREACYHEGPNTFRNMATLGGVAASADWESELLAALLVLDASLRLHGPGGPSTIALSDFLADPKGHLNQHIITGIRFQAVGKTSSARVARTPADKPIVAAAGCSGLDGRLKFALCGAAETPILVEPDALDKLEYPEDFRGSSGYRKEMARVLIKRVLNELDQ